MPESMAGDMIALGLSTDGTSTRKGYNHEIATYTFGEEKWDMIVHKARKHLKVKNEYWYKYIIRSETRPNMYAIKERRRNSGEYPEELAMNHNMANLYTRGANQFLDSINN